MLFLHYVKNKKGKKTVVCLSLVALDDRSLLTAADSLVLCDWLNGEGVEIGDNTLMKSHMKKLPKCH